jgi:tripeptide aminopeptidase
MTDIRRERLIATFVDLVKIPSPSWKEIGVIEYIEKKLDMPGITCTRFPCGDSFNLLVKVDGTRAGAPVLFSCHTDTVVPCENVNPVVTPSRISSDGTTILGADDKAAVAAFLEAIFAVRESGAPHGPLEFLFSCAEELGLYGIKGFDLSAVESKYAFVFDSGGDIGRIVLKAPYHLTYRVSVKGKPAHAGMEPEKGISAIRVLSEMISAIPHGRIDRETTVNVGTVSGGRATNIVAENAEMTLEARSISRKKLAAVDGKIAAAMKRISKKRGTKIRIAKNLEYSGFALSEKDRVVRIVSEAMKSLGITPSCEVSGGGSDTNVINRAGIRAVNVSIGMRNVHTKKEYILTKDLVNGARMVLAIIEGA